MATDYFILVYVAALGALQLAAAYSGLGGLMFLPGRRLSLVLGTALAVGAFAWFFASGERNIPDTEGGLDGNGQAGVFAAAAGAALVSGLVLSSLTNALRLPGKPLEIGLDGLNGATYLQALSGLVAEVSRSWRRQIQQYFSG